jgi:hypothetical protein
MEQVRARRLIRHWGRRFYGDALPQSFCTVAHRRTPYSGGPTTVDANGDVPEELLCDFYLSADLEAYGPIINPLDHVMIETNRPEDQNCTICADGCPSTPTAEQCVRIIECGHCFHLQCIHGWLNVISPNSNLCPECRSFICEVCRRVRPVQQAPPPGVATKPQVAQSAGARPKNTQASHAVSSDLNFVLVAPEETGDLIGFTGHPSGERDARCGEALRRAREAAGTQREEADTNPDQDMNPFESDSVSENLEFGEDRGLLGANDPSDIETFQEAGVTLRVVEPEYYYHGTHEDEEGNVVAGEWVLYGQEVDSDFQFDMNGDSDWQNDFNRHGE